MTRHQKQRLFKVSLILAGVVVAVGLILYALNQNLHLFYTPTDMVEHKAPQVKTVRLGGMVVENSVLRDGIQVQFTLTDFQNEILVRYQGILPDLFREKQGIVALGRVDEAGIFHAQQVLAKHDENYMPPELKAMAKRQT